MNDTTDPGALGADESFAPTHEPFSPSQQIQLAEWAVEAGTMTREEANASLRADGLDPLPNPADPNTPAGEIDAAFPPAEPTEYELPSLLDNPDDPYTPELQALDQARRDWLSLAGFTKEIGDSIGRHVEDGVRNFRTLDEPSRTIQHDAELARVHKHFGDDAERMVGLARQLVDEIDAKRPGLKRFLEETGAGNNSAVIIQFALQADRLYARHG